MRKICPKKRERESSLTSNDSKIEINRAYYVTCTGRGKKKRKKWKLCRIELHCSPALSGEHVTVTRAFQLIKNKRCQRPAIENRVAGTNVIYRQVRGAQCCRGCYLNDCANVIVSDALCVPREICRSRATLQASARLFSSQGKYYAGETRLGESYTPPPPLERDWDGLHTRTRAHTRTRSYHFHAKLIFPRRY